MNSLPDDLPERFLRLADGPEAASRIKGSRFVGQVLRVDSLENAQERLQTIRKQYHDASHHCWAATWGPAGATEERSDDDGEPSGSAGRPILQHLLGCGAGNGLIVVTRWFGGTKLGTGGLAQAYGGAAAAALELAGRVEVERRIPLSVGVDYEDLGAVEAVLARRADWTAHVERDFEAAPRFLLHARRSRARALGDELTEALAGRLRIETGDEILVETGAVL